MATTVAAAATRLAPPGDGKVVRSLRARRGLVARITQRAAQVRDRTRPLVWVHAPSVGEGLQARPVIEALRAAHPDWQVAYTHFSPSAERFAISIGADITDYLPFDQARSADALLDALRPAVLIFSKLDVWPVLVERTRQRGVPVMITSATLARSSGRLGWWSRQLLSDAYRSLSAVGAIDSANADRLVQLGVPRSVLHVTGDTRFDQVWSRAHGVQRNGPLLSALSSSRPTLVAGSTWPADEQVLLDAWVHASWHESPPSSRRLIVAPHEPTEPHLASIEQWARRSALHLQRLSAIESQASMSASSSAPDAIDAIDVVLVDRVGVLGDLYALADVAFVGGGFHDAGLHSAIEPAAFGAPVLFGPRHHMSREAGLLLDAAAARVVVDAADTAAALHGWLNDDRARDLAGAAASQVVERERGATQRTVELIEQCIPNAPV